MTSSDADHFLIESTLNNATHWVWRPRNVEVTSATLANIANVFPIEQLMASPKVPHAFQLESNVFRYCVKSLDMSPAKIFMLILSVSVNCYVNLDSWPQVSRRWRITLDEVALSIFPKKPMWHVVSNMVIAAGMGRRLV